MHGETEDGGAWAEGWGFVAKDLWWGKMASWTHMRSVGVGRALLPAGCWGGGAACSP